MFKELLSVRASLKSGKADQALAELEAVLGPMALADIEQRIEQESQIEERKSEIRKIYQDIRKIKVSEEFISNTMAEVSNKAAQSLADLGCVFELLQAPTEEAKQRLEKWQIELERHNELRIRAVSGCSQAEIEELKAFLKDPQEMRSVVEMAKAGYSIDAICSFYRQQKQASEVGEKFRKDLEQGRVHSVLMGPNKTIVSFVGAGGGGVSLPDGGGGSGGSGGTLFTGVGSGPCYASFREYGYAPKTIKGLTPDLIAKIESAPEAVKGDPVIVNMKLARARLKKFADLNDCPSQEHAIQLMGFNNWMTSPFINQLSLYQLTTPYGGHIATFLGSDIIIGKGITQQARS